MTSTWRWTLMRIPHQPDAKIIPARADRALAAGAENVSTAILIGAEKRSTAKDALFWVGFGGVERRFRALRIACAATTRGELGIIIRTVPITNPFPGVSGNVV